MTDLLRQEIAANASMIVVKVGSRVLTHPDGRLDEQQIRNLALQFDGILATGRKVVLVSSGAVASGMGRLGLPKRPHDLAHLQAIAAIGQSVLVEAYERFFAEHGGHHAAQVLLTADDLDNRTRYLNARNTLLSLLELNAIPIINENDTVSVEELQTTFGDNDRLAALVTNLIRAPLLVLLSDVDGLYDGDPADPASKVIPVVEQIDESTFNLVRDKVSGLSKGGMASKLKAARIATTAGENVIITRGRADVLSRIIAGEQVGTLFLAQGQSLSSRQRWIGLTVQPRGKLLLDAGASTAIQHRGRSLLAAGITGVEGRFIKGDVVAVLNAAGVEIARGLCNYSSDEIARIKGLKSTQIAQCFGSCPYEEVIHRDNIVVTKGNGA